MNCMKCTMFADSSPHHFRPYFLGLCDQPNCLPYRTPGMYVRHDSVCVALSFAIGLCFRCPAMRLPLVIPMFHVKRPSIAWRLITNCYVFDCGVYLSERVKVTVMLRLHLTQTKMRTILCTIRPTRFLCNDLIEALEFLIVQNPWMCIKFQMVYRIVCWFSCWNACYWKHCQ